MAHTPAPTMDVEAIAAKIVNRFSWSSNVMRNGRLVGEQIIVAEAIADALHAERENTALSQAMLKAALAELSALRDSASAEEWQDIESAPKDGQLFLAYWGDVPVFCFAEPDGKTFRVAMLTRDGKFGVHGNYAPFVPKAWRPIPSQAITRAPAGSKP